MPRSAPFAALFATALLLAPPLISCARNPVTGKNRALPGVGVAGDRNGEGGESADHPVDRSGERSPAPGVRLRDRAQDREGVGATQSAVGIPRGERRVGQRIRAPGRIHLRHPRTADVHQRRGGARHRASVTRSATSPIGTRSSRSARRKWRVSDSDSAAFVSPTFARYAGVAGQGLQVLFLKYSRQAESEADLAGFRYALNQNYDVREMSNVFQTLDRVSTARGRWKAPQLAADSPGAGRSHQRHQARLDTLHKDLSNSIINRDQYLQHIRGLTFGEDPRQGYFQGGRFLHPDLRFQITFPQGWQTQNTADAVMAGSPNQDAIIQLALGGKGLATRRGDAVPVATGRDGRQRIDREHQRATGGLQLLRGADGPGGGAGARHVHLVWREHLRNSGIHSGRKARNVRRRSSGRRRGASASCGTRRRSRCRRRRSKS